VANRITPENLVKMWVEIHGQMPTRFHPEFRARPEIAELVKYPPEVLIKAFKVSPRLILILREAQRLHPRITQGKTSDPRPSQRTSQILPLPGDPGATRRPGKKREHYKTGEQAELRHLARQYKWWE
jgi:hypothetical protein